MSDKSHITVTLSAPIDQNDDGCDWEYYEYYAVGWGEDWSSETCHYPDAVLSELF